MRTAHGRRAVGAVLALTFAITALLTTAAAASASGVKLTQAQAVSKLHAAGITWSSSGHCSTRSNPSCTSFDQINSGTIDGIVTLKRASGCPINITGGTEAGHASGTYSHYHGYKVDITPNACVSNYITRNFTYIGLRGDGARQYRSHAGNIYARESTHWDILYY
jgi:hypothetical protein